MKGESMKIMRLAKMILMNRRGKDKTHFKLIAGIKTIINIVIKLNKY